MQRLCLHAYPIYSIREHGMTYRLGPSYNFAYISFHMCQLASKKFREVGLQDICFVPESQSP